MFRDGIEVDLEVVWLLSDGENGTGRGREGSGHIRDPSTWDVRSLEQMLNISNLKLRNILIFSGFLSHVCLVGSRVGVASVSLGIDADAGAVVGRADEFDAGGFEGCFDGIDGFY